MEPEDALWTDRSVFESELDGLIDSAMKSASSPSLKRCANPSTPMPNKRSKTVHQETESFKRANDYGLHVHQTRRSFLDQQNYQVFTDHSSLRDYQSQRRSTTNPDAQSDYSSSGISIPPRTSKGSGQHIQNWPTLSNTVRRQWDPRWDNLDYEALLDRRRREKLQNVDRYVPEHQARVNRLPKNAKPFPFTRLPRKIQGRILSLLLVSSEPITIDFYWLRPFVKGHARVPEVTQRVEHEGTTYWLPVSWARLLSDVELMRSDMLQFGGALEARGVKTRWSRSPGRGLTTSLLRVSREVHKVAAQVFYGENVFKFPCATSAWMQLDAFLATIGPQNVESIQHIRIHCPLWHRGVQEDFVEGAVVDLLSPASRMAVIKPPPHDRLLSAIRHAIQTLLGANLVTLSLDLENGIVADYWSGRYTNDKRMISIAEAEEFFERKNKGVELLGQVSNMLAASHNRPVLSLYPPSKTSPPDDKEFRKRLPGLTIEAEKYGWQVHPSLKDSR